MIDPKKKTDEDFDPSENMTPIVYGPPPWERSLFERCRIAVRKRLKKNADRRRQRTDKNRK